MAKDSVCGMEMDEKKAPAKSRHMGKTYYFCAPACKGAFGEDPPSTLGVEGMKWPDMPVTNCSLGFFFAALGKERQPCLFLNR
jgi:YHS domain-containing protein